MLPRRSDSRATRRNEMSAVSTCTRFCARHSNSGCMPFAELLRVSERISRDCSSLECAYRNRTCPRVSHYLLSLPDSSIKLSTELASPRVHLDTTAHHAPIIWLGTQSQTVQGACETPPRNYPYAHIYTTAPVR